MALPVENAARKALPLWTFLFGYFPKAWLAVANVSIVGNEQHNPGEPLHWAREKSTDQLNTAFRHQFDYGMGTKRDTDGQWHLAKAIWRLSAQLQLDIEEEEKQDADAARFGLTPVKQGPQQSSDHVVFERHPVPKGKTWAPSDNCDCEGCRTYRNLDNQRVSIGLFS